MKMMLRIQLARCNQVRRFASRIVSLSARRTKTSDAFAASTVWVRPASACHACTCPFMTSTARIWGQGMVAFDVVGQVAASRVERVRISAVHPNRTPPAGSHGC
jgi:hypothetical protein